MRRCKSFHSTLNCCALWEIIYNNRGGSTWLAGHLKRQSRFGQVNPETWHLIDLGEVATSCYARCQELLGRLDAAIETLRESEARFAGSIRLRRQMLDLYVRHDRRKEALDEVNRTPVEASQREALRLPCAEHCLAAKGNYVAGLPYLQAAFGSGCRDVIVPAMVDDGIAKHRRPGRSGTRPRRVAT